MERQSRTGHFAEDFHGGSAPIDRKAKSTTHRMGCRTLSAHFPLSAETSWNAILQLKTANGLVHCRRYAIPTLSRACRILIYSCDAAADAAATDTHAKIEAQLGSDPATRSTACSGPVMWGCLACDETSRLQLLVPVIGANLSPQARNDIQKWLSQGQAASIVMPSLLPAIAHADAFRGASPALSSLTATDWRGDPDRLAASVLHAALLRTKPSVFISYKRSEAGPLADQMFDALAHGGFRVFLDRFSGTAGRYFPQELAEEMADKAVLLVIETPELAKSKWTLWEIAFAHRYKLGLMALRMPGAPAFNRIRTRLPVTPTPDGKLNPTDLLQAMNFVRREQIVAGLRRTGFYRGLVRSVALAGGGGLREPADGMFELRKAPGGAANTTAIISATGAPGRLGDVHALLRHAAPAGSKPQRLLLGQHRHLPPEALEDLEWLAGETAVELRGDYDGYRRTRALC